MNYTSSYLMTNQKINTYIEDGEMFMGIECDCKDPDGSQTLHFNIPKIGLNEIMFDLQRKRQHYDEPKLKHLTKNILINATIGLKVYMVNDELFTITVDEKPKEMTIEEIEKELGYKIKIKD